MKEISKYSMKETLCWSCAKCYGDCSWSREFEPVEGWEAIRRDVKISKGQSPRYVESYIIRSCPLFEPDENK